MTVGLYAWCFYCCQYSCVCPDKREFKPVLFDSSSSFTSVDDEIFPNEPEDEYFPPEDNSWYFADYERGI